MSALHRQLAALIVCSALGFGLRTHAEVLFSSDFQDGKTTGWSAVGKGDVRLTSYAGNVSLRLARGAMAVAMVSADRYHDVTITLAFAAQNLGPGGACVAQVSLDAGHHWREIWRLPYGSDDGVSLRRGGGLVDDLAGQARILLRVQNAGLRPQALCWVDDISVVGTAFTRTALSAKALATASQRGPWLMATFARPAGAPTTTHNHFEGRLQLTVERPTRDFSVLVDRYGDAVANAGAAAHLPSFDFDFVQSDGALIPVRRGSIANDHPEWEFILEPGSVWDEPDDGEFTRAAVPFTLEERNANCMHNGVLTFLFKSDGTISDVAYEIAQGTCAYFQFNLWGYSAARYVPARVATAARVIADFHDELAARMPTRPFPAGTQFGSALDVPSSSLTVYGLVDGLVDGGVHYTSACQTRLGDYPYCDVLDLPSYSLAKTLVGGIGALWLAARYPGVLEARISDYVPACRAADGWGDVTFANALDMATGHYRSADDQHDEDAADMLGFFLAEDHADKLRFACTHYPRKAAPGTVWVYHTTDSYLLGTALNAFYRAKTRSDADFYHDVLAGQLWPALHLSPPVGVTRRTRDAAQQPFTGYGLTLHRDDIAKLANFLNVDHGEIGASVLLDQAQLNAALQRDPAHPGLRAGANDLRYNHGFWAWNAQVSLGCREPTWIPFLSGYGGIIVALLPNGMSYYYVSDGGVFRWAQAAAEANRTRPFCHQ